MKISKILMAAAFGLGVGLVAGSVAAQSDAAQMDPGQWNRFEEHVRKLQHQIDVEVQNGSLDANNAIYIERTLDDANLHANLQHWNPGGGDHVPFWEQLHRVHEKLGGNWGPEFDRH